MKILITNYDYPGLVKALEELGNEVVADERLNWWSWCWGSGEHKPGSPEEYHAFLTKQVHDLKIEAVIIGKGFDSNKRNDGTNPNFWHILPKTVEHLTKSKIPVVWLSLDQPDDFGWSISTKMPIFSSAIGTCCIEVKDFYKNYTESQVFEFWPAWDQTARSIPKVEKEYDVVLVGTPYNNPNDQFGIPRKDIAMAIRDAGLNLAIYGPDRWIYAKHGGDESLKEFYKGFVAFDAVHKAYAKAKITYNSFLRRGFRYVNDRIFMAGPVSFLLMEEQMGLDMVFQEKKHVGYHKFNDMEDFKKKLNFWIKEDDLRERCAANMRDLILREHTYAQRAVPINSIIKETVAEFKKKDGCCRG